jgi:glycosyltransferase involved in cell wall biosynthesis
LEKSTIAYSVSMKASVFFMTYNHAAYVAESVSSICSQSIANDLEVIWHDDASTDSTREVGERAFERFSGRLVKIFRKYNRLQRRIPFLLDLLERCSSDYIFLLEGDDRWINNEKCRLSVSLLESNPNQNLLFTAATIIDQLGRTLEAKLGFHGSSSGILSCYSAISLDGGAMPTCTLCLRKAHFENAPGFVFEYPALDFGIQMYCAYPNGAIYLPDLTGSWRSQTEGNHTARILSDPNARLYFERDLTELLRKARTYFPAELRSAIDKVYLLHLNRLVLQGVYTPISLRSDFII